MSNVNPFAKKAEQANAEPAMEGHGFNFLAALSEAFATVCQVEPIATSYEARCGGRFKRNSIKQRTRLNRDLRNRERRYAKYGALMTRNLVRVEV